MRWNESDHPRAPDGRFGHGRGPTVHTRAPDGTRTTQRGTAAPAPQRAKVTTRSLSQQDFKEHDRDTTEDVEERAGDAVAARWKVTPADLAALAAEEGIPLAGKDADQDRRQVARYLVRSWSGGSGSPAHIVAIAAVTEDLGLDDHNNPRARQVISWAREHPDIDRALRGFGRAMYAETQAWLAEHGVDELAVSRAGFSNDKARPWTSWSLGHGGMRHEPGRVERHAGIPARLVMSVPPTGFGTLAESEAVVLPGW